MKNELVRFIIGATALLAFPHTHFAQAPDLGTTVNFALFSTAGAVGNTGISRITGDIGTNVGAVSGFGNVNGVMYPVGTVTAQAATDLQAAYNQLNATAFTATHGPVLGGGETLFGGVYSLAAAGSLSTVLNLDAQGDPTKVFIFKIGGAFTTGASSSVNLVNGALACNVFWKAEGAISMAAGTVIRGTLIANNGAIDMGDGGIIEGRALSTTGAVSVYGTVATIPDGCGSPVLNGPLAPDLNSLECYALFSSSGNLINSGVTDITGDVGSNNGSTTGFNAGLVNGAIHPIPDAHTGQAADDYPDVYSYLNTLAYDIELLYPAQFGNNLVLTPHTYRMSTAATLTNLLYLNAEGNANAIFIIQVNGALTTSSASEVRLINGAQARNVYWKVEGAVTINDNSVFCGTIIGHNGAIVLNSGVTLNGRAITNLGNINTTAIAASIPSACNISVLPMTLVSFTGVCQKQSILLKWSATTRNNNYFTVERSTEGINWQSIGTVKDRQGSILQNYSFAYLPQSTTPSYYRVKQTDFDGKEQYGKIVVIHPCHTNSADQVIVYPNPSTGLVTLSYTGERDKVRSTTVFNSLGKKMYTISGFASSLDLSLTTPGLYFVQFNTGTSTFQRTIIVK